MKSSRKIPAAESPTTVDDQEPKKKKMKEGGDTPEVDADDGSEVNPYLLDPVLKVMTKMMTIDDLKMARQLCQSWNHQSMTELSTLQGVIKPLNMWDESKINEFNIKMSESMYKKVLSPNCSYGLQYNASSKTLEKYFDNFTPQNVQLTLTTGGCDEQLIQVLRVSCTYLKKLELTGSIDDQCLKKSSPSSSPTAVSVDYPNLEELSIRLEVNCEGRTLFETFCNEIALKSPKLKSLKLINNCSQLEQDTLSSDLLKSSIILHLEELHLSNNYYTCSPVHDDLNTLFLGPKELDQLTHNGLKLKNFSNIIYFVAHNEEYVKDYYSDMNHFLQSQSTFLQNLELNVGTVFVHQFPVLKCQLTVPSLPHLKVLRLGNYSYIDFNPYKKINLSFFEHLEEIIIELNTSKWNEIFEGLSKSVEKLTIIYCTRLFSKTNFDQLSNYFTKVKFVSLCATCANKPILEKIKNNLKTLPWTETLEKLTLKMPALYLSMIDFKKSISHLKGLKKLELIDDISAKTDHCNQLNLQSLQELPIKNIRIKNFKVSDQDIEELRKKFVLDYTFSYTHVQQ